MEKKCLQCNKIMFRKKLESPSYFSNKKKYCSYSCSATYIFNHLTKEELIKRNFNHSGKKLSIEQKEKLRIILTGRIRTPEHCKNISVGKKGKVRKGFSPTPETREKISKAQLGKIVSAETIQKLSDSHKGEKSHKWIKDRSEVIDQSLRRTTEGRQWRRKVFLRDNKKCKINNEDCNGQLETHHILPFRDYPELRYDINNGITLCHYHHPLKPSEEKRLSPYFQELISKK